MKRFLVILGIVAALGVVVYAEHPLTYYNAVSFYETTNRGECIWFFGMDSLYGPVHSNDLIWIKNRPVFYDTVSTCRDRFVQGEGYNPEFHSDTLFNVPQVRFEGIEASLQARATTIIDTGDGRQLTTIQFRGEDGLSIYQRPIGIPGEDSLIAELPVDTMRIIYVDGYLDLEGVVAGRVTVLASQDIGLIDNLRYHGSDSLTGDFDEDTTTTMLGVVAGRDIIIKNNIANGKFNVNWQARRGQDSSSIVLNGSYIALNESFTFEDQNDEGDRYLGPTPDERGKIFLTGGIAQHRRGYVHRANHQGTGYGKRYRYDNRLRTQSPPGLSLEELRAPVRGRYLPQMTTLTTFPNPFNASTRLTYSIPASVPGSVRVFDVSGREVATLFQGSLAAGSHSLDWNAAGYQSGVYLVKLQTPGFSATRKVVLVR